MNKTIRIILLLFFFSLTAALTARGIFGDRTTRQNDVNTVQVTGRVRLVGNEPVTELVISGQDYDWYIDIADAYKLRDLQHRTVTVEANETVVTLTFASGIPAGERRILNNIRIIKVE